MGEVRYRRQSINFLGVMQTQLRDLQGIATLTYELIQNADDVRTDDGKPGATKISFDLCDDALIVENDGVFREVDFDRISFIADGGKREEQGTTGAFGVGFIAVYQITDAPEIFSSGRHWIIRPDQDEHHRIEERDAQVTGTCFRLPWACDAHSTVRRKLMLEAVRPDQIDEFENEMTEAISHAAPFLKQLTTLELKRNGQLVKSIYRVIEGDQLLLEDDGHTTYWKLLNGDFDAKAQELKDQHPHIEAKRRSHVQIALPDSLEAGRLYAVLPSETIVPLPFHINADFFPTSDRKRIIFGQDYQSDWNRTAIRSAAVLLLAHFDELKNSFGHEKFWELIAKISDCREDPVFGVFWQILSPAIREGPSVFTTAQQWQKPGLTRFADSEAEVDAAPILEGLNIQIVHADLRKWRNLLVQPQFGINVPRLDLQTVVTALRQAGLTHPTALADAPLPLRTKDAWPTLWKTLEELAKYRPGRQAQDKLLALLNGCAIAPEKSGELWPPELLKRNDEATQSLFPHVKWLDNVFAATVDLFTSLVVDFGPADAVSELEQLEAAGIENAWRAGGLDLLRLHEWFQARKDKWMSKEDLKRRLRALSIWPTGEGLRPLDGLYLLGDFRDPFNLARFVDLEALQNRVDLLKDLGVQTLDITTYLREELPRVFAQRTEILADDCRQILQLLAEKSGTLTADRDLGRALGTLSFIECDDGNFYPAQQVYTRSEVRAVLGGKVRVVASTNSIAITSVLGWLGAQSIPRPADILQRVKELTNTPPTPDTRSTIQSIFKYLVDHWLKFDDALLKGLEPLKYTSWLPGRHNQARWYKPSELFVVYRDYIFETQAEFLDFEREIQNSAGTVGLVKYLGLQDEPSPRQVVNHLIKCAQTSATLSTQVYRYLNDKVDDPAINDLLNHPCLILPDGRYILPTQAFWNEHPFGARRVQLGPEWRSFHQLLAKLGVRDGPGPSDYLEVLLEIAGPKSELDDEALTVVQRCWRGLNQALTDRTPGIEEQLQQLADRRVIPNQKRLLVRPKHTFFEDRPGLAAKFGDFLTDNVIERPHNAWQAMRVAGVQFLGQAVEIRLTEFTDAVEDVSLQNRLQERLSLIARIAETERTASSRELAISSLSGLKFQRARQLEIQYEITAFNRRETTAPEPVPAWLYDDEILVTYVDSKVPWAAIARELAYKLKPEGEIGGLAGGLRYVLEPETVQEAKAGLDELGYPPLQEWIDSPTSQPGVVGVGGVDVPPADYPSTPHGENEPTTPRDSIPDAKQTTPDRQPDGTAPDTMSEGGKDAPHSPASPLDQTKTAPKPSTNRPRSRLRSYVLPAKEGDHKNSDRQSKDDEGRLEVAEAGVKRVMVYERQNGRSPKLMNFSNEGYDIESLQPDDQIRYIEVKALSGQWDARSAAGLTSAEFNHARRNKEKYWLYVVEFALDDDLYRIHRIQNPAQRIDQYLFDDGWRSIAEKR